MVDFETELKTARGLFEKRLKTLKRIQYHIRHLSKSSDEYSAGTVARKIAEAEVSSARQRLEEAIHSVRQKSQQQQSSASITSSERDHFSEALARVDPQSRLQLGR